MSERLNRPSEDECRKQIRKLRKFIENDDNDLIERRVAEIMEDTLRWEFLKTTWPDPVDNLGMASVIRRDFEKD